MLYPSGNSSAQDQNSKTGLEELFAIFTEEEIVVSALKNPRTVSKSPAIMSVVTAKQIKQMGFRTLTQVLKIIPGFDISMDRTGERDIGVRGVLNKTSETVKLLIDGHSVNDPFTGGASFNFDDLVVENAKRIEIIRGPGSALYGQNAFLAVINVITKDTEDIDGFQWTLSYGSFDRQQYNMLFGKEVGDLKISGYFDYLDTDGFSEMVDQDILFPKPFSQSPGRSQNEKEKTDLNLKLSYKNLEIKGKYMKKRREPYIGIGDALHDHTNLRDTYLFGELVYKLPVGEKLSITPRVYYDQYNFDPLLKQRPNGFVGPFLNQFGFPSIGFYPSGLEGKTSFEDMTIGFENQINYHVFKGNELTFGFQYEWIHQHDIKSKEFTFHPLTLAPLPAPMDFTDTFPFTRKATRQIWALYLQDEWNITDDIDVTVGVRYDHFPRFGSTTNPRFGLIWRFVEDAQLKLLFATAFRAPSFQELFLINNPVVIGNPSLDPEKVDTFEIGLGYNITEHIRCNVNYFYNRIRDRIFPVPGNPPVQFGNTGGARINGVEAELKADFGNNNYFYANYTYQDAEETSTRSRLADVPIHKANFGINIDFWKYVNANLHTFISGPRPRQSGPDSVKDGDTRADLPSHTVVDLTFVGKNFIDNFEIRSSIFNLFDKGYDDPAPKNTVPTDYPQQERSFIVELRYSF